MPQCWYTKDITWPKYSSMSIGFAQFKGGALMMGTMGYVVLATRIQFMNDTNGQLCLNYDRRQ